MILFLLGLFIELSWPTSYRIEYRELRVQALVSGV